MDSLFDIDLDFENEEKDKIKELEDKIKELEETNKKIKEKIREFDLHIKTNTVSKENYDKLMRKCDNYNKLKLDHEYIGIKFLDFEKKFQKLEKKYNKLKTGIKMSGMSIIETADDIQVVKY